MKQGVRKKRIAFTGGGAHTIPSYRALLESLCNDYDLTVYSEFYIPVRKGFSYTLKSVPGWKLPTKVKYVLFLFLILKDALVKGFDIIHAHSTYPAGLCSIITGKVFRIPVVVSLDAAEASAIPSIGFGDLMGPKRKRINHWVITKATEVIVLTEFLLLEVRKNLLITRPMHVIPRGVNTLMFTYHEREIKEPVRFINVAYIHPVKDQRTLLKCFARICESVDGTLTLIGKDYEDGAIQQLAIDMGLKDKVRFVGFVPNEQLPEHYEHADVMLHTSLFESQAVVVSEAMASGVIVCGTHVGLMADLSGSCCITVPASEGVALGDAVVKLLSYKDEVRRIRTNAYQWLQEHDLAWTAERHRGVYEAL